LNKIISFLKFEIKKPIDVTIDYIQYFYSNRNENLD
jgi:hypothetical protein